MPGRCCRHGARHGEAVLGTALLIDMVHLNYTVKCNMARYELFSTISVDSCLELKAQGLILCHVSMTPNGVNGDIVRADELTFFPMEGRGAPCKALIW